MPDKKLPAVPETILKRRKRQAAARAERAKATVAAKKVRIFNFRISCPVEDLSNFLVYFDATPYFNVASYMSKKLDIQCHYFQAAHAKRKEVFQRAEKYVKQYREKERDEIRLKREAKKNNGYVDMLWNGTHSRLL